MRALVLVAVMLMTGCSVTPSKTMVPGGEREFCRENPTATICMGLLQKTTLELFDSFRYVTDLEQYGVLDHWAPLAEKDGVLYGDCEDCIISLLDHMVANGLSAQHVTLYLAEDTPDKAHMVMRYGHFYIDCTERLITQSGGRFKLLSRRSLTESRWTRIQNFDSKRSML